MAQRSSSQLPAAARLRRGYFESRYGQLHVHHAFPAGGGFEERTPLLAVHDRARPAGLFEGLLAAAGADRSAFAPDLPGFGQSDGPGEPLSIADHAEALGDFIDTMRLRQVDLLGCGFGALVALELAVSQPTVRKVALMPLPAVAAPPPAGSGPDALRAFILEEWERASAACAPETPLQAIMRAFGERLLSGTPIAWATAAEREYPLRERLAGLSRPMLVLIPTDVPPPNPTWTEIPSARARRELPAGAARLETAPDAFFEAIKDFLDS